ncbi:hypothetical protein LTR84_009780 [Exophiala bonariae]|uniref:Transcription factor domain-containing protein n=1 Tax=Exophiala bonariae TaxID=1690606 RepID=A0AAV9NJA3_9EURO|nr:hypothetical protein LTR84_009780 [Exophiala bonariae]
MTELHTDSTDITDIIWLDNKTPKNFHAKTNRRQLGTIAQRAQHYSKWRREEKLREEFAFSTKRASTTSNRNDKVHQGVLVLRQHLESEAGARANNLPSFARRYKTSELDSGFIEFQVGPRNSRGRKSTSNLAAQPRPASPSIPSYLGGNADPFDATPVPLDSWNYGILAYIRPFTLNTVWPVEMENSRGQSYVSPAHKSVYKAFVSHLSVSHAMLAYSWAVMLMLRPDQKEECHYKITQHVLRAMHALRSIIASLSQESDLASMICALQTVQTLTSAEIYRGNREATSQHRRALGVLLGLIGESRNVPWILRSAISFLIVRVAANTGTRTDVDPSYWDPGPWCTQDIPVGEMVSPRIHPALLEDTITPQSARANDILPGLFANLREVLAVMEEHKRTSSISSEDNYISTLQWAHSRRMAIRGRIGNHWADITETCQSVAPQTGTLSSPTTVHFATVDMCLCLAMLIFISYGLESPMAKRQHWIPSGQIHHLMLLRCTRKLGFELEAVDVEEHAATGIRDLLWVCAVGVHVEEEYALWKRSAKTMPLWWDRLDPDEFDVRWFSIRFGVFARRLGFENFEDVVDLLKREYVYVAEVYDVVLKRAFELV